MSQESEKNRIMGTFNMQKEFWQTWYCFNYLLQKDDKLNSFRPNKGMQSFRSFVIRQLIARYVNDNLPKFVQEEYEKFVRVTVKENGGIDFNKIK